MQRFQSKIALLHIRPHDGPGGPGRCWYTFLGSCAGEANDSRDVDFRIAIDCPLLGYRCSIPIGNVGELETGDTPHGQTYQTMWVDARDRAERIGLNMWVCFVERAEVNPTEWEGISEDENPISASPVWGMGSNLGRSSKSKACVWQRQNGRTCLAQGKVDT